MYFFKVKSCCLRVIPYVLFKKQTEVNASYFNIFQAEHYLTICHKFYQVFVHHHPLFSLYSIHQTNSENRLSYNYCHVGAGGDHGAPFMVWSTLDMAGYILHCKS